MKACQFGWHRKRRLFKSQADQKQLQGASGPLSLGFESSPAFLKPMLLERKVLEDSNPSAFGRFLESSVRHHVRPIYTKTTYRNQYTILNLNSHKCRGSQAV